MPAAAETTQLNTPVEGYDFVLQADGGSRGNPGTAGYGAVLYDADGQLLADAAGPLGIATNNVAEYSGLVAGLELLHSYAPGGGAGLHVLVQMDSKLVVEQMSGRWKIKHQDMQQLARKAHQILPAAMIEFEWIPREKNTVADALSNEAMDACAAGQEQARVRHHQHDEAGVHDEAATHDAVAAGAKDEAIAGSGDAASRDAAESHELQVSAELSLRYADGELVLQVADGSAAGLRETLETWGVPVHSAGPAASVGCPVRLAFNPSR